MNVENLILLALVIPLVGALGIGLAGRYLGPNARETVTFVTAGLLAAAVWQIVPLVYNGERPGLVLAEILPGIEIAFRVEPLGMMFVGKFVGCSQRSLRVVAMS